MPRKKKTPDTPTADEINQTIEEAIDRMRASAGDASKLTPEDDPVPMVLRPEWFAYFMRLCGKADKPSDMPTLKVVPILALPHFEKEKILYAFLQAFHGLHKAKKQCHCVGCMKRMDWKETRDPATKLPLVGPAKSVPLAVMMTGKPIGCTVACSECVNTTVEAAKEHKQGTNSAPLAGEAVRRVVLTGLVHFIRDISELEQALAGPYAAYVYPEAYAQQEELTRAAEEFIAGLADNPDRNNPDRNNPDRNKLN